MKQPAMKQVVRPITVRLPEDVARKLRIVAAERDESRHALMRRVLVEYVDRKLVESGKKEND